MCRVYLTLPLTLQTDIPVAGSAAVHEFVAGTGTVIDCDLELHQKCELHLSVGVEADIVDWSMITYRYGSHGCDGYVNEPGAGKVVLVGAEGNPTEDEEHHKEQQRRRGTRLRRKPKGGGGSAENIVKHEKE